MRVFAICLVLSIAGAVEAAGQPKKDAKHASAGSKLGIKTPGVQIPVTSLKADAEFTLSPDWMVFGDAVLLHDPQTGNVVPLDPKTNKLAQPVAGQSKTCGGSAAGFATLWIPNCADHTLIRLEQTGWKQTARIDTGIGSAQPAVAASSDSVWILSDDKTTLLRIDPEQNKPVADLRLPAGCNTLAFGEGALWITCPAENRVLRVDPQTNLVDKRIEVSAQPSALAIGETSVWVLCLKEGKVERIDPKTNKVTKTIDLSAPATRGGMAIGQGSVWVTLSGFPLTRIDPQTEKVVQQFWGPGGGAVQFGQGSLWLSNLQEGTLWRLDPRRIAATLAE